LVAMIYLLVGDRPGGAGPLGQLTLPTHACSITGIPPTVRAYCTLRGLLHIGCGASTWSSISKAWGYCRGVCYVCYRCCSEATGGVTPLAFFEDRSPPPSKMSGILILRTMPQNPRHWYNTRGPQGPRSSLTKGVRCDPSGRGCRPLLRGNR